MIVIIQCHLFLKNYPDYLKNNNLKHFVFRTNAGQLRCDDKMAAFCLQSDLTLEEGVLPANMLFLSSNKSCIKL